MDALGASLFYWLTVALWTLFSGKRDESSGLLKVGNVKH